MAYSGWLHLWLLFLLRCGMCLVNHLAVYTHPILTGLRWKNDEQPLRIGIWISGAPFGQLLGTAIDLGAINLDGTFAASPWKWLYIIFGSIAMGYGVIIYCLLPSTPMSAWFLNKRECAIAIKRLASNKTGVRNKSIIWSQVWQALKDPQVWMLCVIAFCFNFSNVAISR